jgi:uncharacterized protein (TIGR02246 family)
MKRTIIAAFLVVFSSSSLAAQRAPAGKTASAGDLPVHEMAASFVSAINNKDVSQALKLYADDAVMMPPGAFSFQGRDKIEAFLKQIFDAGLSDYALTPVAWWTRGDTGYEVATYTLSIGTGAQRVQDKGKIMLILQRGTDGQWRTSYDIWNSDVPAASK